MDAETIRALYEVAGALLDGFLQQEDVDASSLQVFFAEAGYQISVEVKRVH